jgi:hypothetical protein
MADTDPIFNHLFFALPELTLDEALQFVLRDRGYITEEGLQELRRLRRNKARVNRIRAKTKGKPVIQRLLAIAPELATVEVVNLLRRFNYIGERDGHLLRLAVRGVGAIRGTQDSRAIGARARALFGVGFSEEMVNLLRSMDAVTVDQGNKIRVGINATEALLTAGTKARRAKSLVDWLMLAGSTSVDENLLRALRLSGVINARTANAMMEAARYTSAQWTVWEGAKKAEGLAARMAYVVSGSFSWEAVAFLESLGIMDPKYRSLLNVAVTLSQSYNRQLMEQLTNRKYRILPNESPIVTFARSTKESTSRISRLLAAAAKESSKDAAKMHGLSAAQRRVRAVSLHRSIREMWEGVAHITIFGERAAAEAGVEATMALQRAFNKHLPEDVQRMLMIQGKSAVDAYISRQENRIELSRRVYKNTDLFIGKIDKRINVNLLKGASAEELAKDISRFINPNVMGGVKYAAMRLARTELANAFHTTTIRQGREMPWVTGYKWNLSGSHGRPDVCNEYAGDDHDGLGAGIFKKANVPGKPHPQCLCYLTMEQVDEQRFIRNMKSGRYNQYMTQMMRDPSVTATVGEGRKQRAAAAMADYVLPLAASAYVKMG